MNQILGGSFVLKPSMLYIEWACRRCGFTGGWAKTTIPVAGWSEPMMRELHASAKRKVVMIHMRHSQGKCIPSYEDIELRKVTGDKAPDGTPIVGVT